MEDLYTEAGYRGRQVGFGSRPAVLVVDFQKAVTDPGSPMGRSPLVQSAVESTARLLGEARHAGLPVVSCVTAYRPDLKDRPAWKVASVDDWIEGSWLAQMDERVWREGDVLVTKKAPSIFFGTPVASILNREGVDTVIVTGANTSGCIRATVIDSFSYGFRTIVPRECVGDQGEEPHEANLLDVDRRYADVLPLDEVLSEIGGVASLSEAL
jgi:maleamate amidohydrolase